MPRMLWVQILIRSDWSLIVVLEGKVLSVLFWIFLDLYWSLGSGDGVWVF